MQLKLEIDNVQKLPAYALVILRYISSQGKKTQTQLIEELNLPIRKVRYAVRLLLEEGLIRKIPNLNDMRSVFYMISSEIIDIEDVIEHLYAKT